MQDADKISIEAAASHADKEGYFVTANGSGKSALVTGATDRALGVIVSGAASGSEDSVALPGSRALVKLSGTVKKGDEVQLAADATVLKNAGSGGRVVVGIMLEAGVSGDLKNAKLCPPLALS